MKRRVVIADDDPTIVTLVSLCLEAGNYEVFAAPSSEDALIQIRRHHPHAAILDVQMPGTDGLEALGQIKADPAIAAIPVMILTGERDPQTVMRALGAGASDYMVKPFHPDMLAERLARMLRHAAA
ncbi:MAG TPA: response regulator [Rhizomicrobium sp.]|jgi:DNA-binding response OmpR family regulator|nr:response regulator [Rhizomicrobium sp.]